MQIDLEQEAKERASDLPIAHHAINCALVESARRQQCNCQVFRNILTYMKEQACSSD